MLACSCTQLAVTLIKGGQFDGTVAALDKALLSLPAADAVLLERELAGPNQTDGAGAEGEGAGEERTPGGG